MIKWIGELYQAVNSTPKNSKAFHVKLVISSKVVNLTTKSFKVLSENHYQYKAILLLKKVSNCFMIAHKTLFLQLLFLPYYSSTKICDF